ncbi:MAG: 6-bladed beta-propeller [Mediterranea sp.]|jgi:hypothetical protein|nr:6-bladed beta-propeller [Mediterranea sp.]
MRIIKAIALALLPLSIAGCTGKQQSKAPKLAVVDLSTAYPQQELKAQEVFDVEYIPLESTDEFVTQGVVEDVGEKLLLIRNYRDGSFFLFDRNGKGVRRINHRGQGGEEYTQIMRAILDEKSQEVFIVDGAAKQVVVYDLQGAFKRRFKFADTSYYTNIYNYDAEHLIAFKGYSPLIESEQSGFVLLSKQSGTISKEITLPAQAVRTPIITKGEMTLTMSFYLSAPCREGWLLMRPSSDTIYHYSPAGELSTRMVRTPSIQTMEEPATFLFPATDSERYYFLHTLSKKFDFERMKGTVTPDLAYDKQEHRVFEYTMYNDDFSTPKELSLNSQPIGHDIALCLPLDAPMLVEARQKGELKGALKEIASSLNDESNPVLMLLKHRRHP